MVDYDLAEPAVGTSVFTQSHPGSGSVDAVSVLLDPAYREKYLERFNECVVKKGMDMVQYADGSISTIENTIRVNSYEWNKRKCDFERSRKSRKSVAKRMASSDL